ncbi:Hypothetical protein EAG7_00900 [Klebsiella aerogenes]|nr:Hypothetical protein EAG7_00900 [Klebsiella aerogenes]
MQEIKWLIHGFGFGMTCRMIRNGELYQEYQNNLWQWCRRYSFIF